MWAGPAGEVAGDPGMAEDQMRESEKTKVELSERTERKEKKCSESTR